MMFWPDHDLSGWGWFGMTVSMVLFWGLLIAAGVMLVRAFNRSSLSDAAGSRPSPEQLLAERFARGEIDEDEYRTRLAVLHSSNQVAQRP
jgi:putative membrane protein